MSCDFPIFSIAITKKVFYPMISPMISIKASRYGSFDTSGAAKAQRPRSGSLDRPWVIFCGKNRVFGTGDFFFIQVMVKLVKKKSSK
jgi:hypothetical protein